MYKKQPQQRSISHNCQNVSALRSPKTQAKILALCPFTAVHSQILSFLSRQTFATHQFEQSEESNRLGEHWATVDRLV
jgi:hypothetical protein